MPWPAVARMVDRDPDFVEEVRQALGEKLFFDGRLSANGTVAKRSP